MNDIEELRKFALEVQNFAFGSNRINNKSSVCLGAILNKLKADEKKLIDEKQDILKTIRTDYIKLYPARGGNSRITKLMNAMKHEIKELKQEREETKIDFEKQKKDILFLLEQKQTELDSKNDILEIAVASFKAEKIMRQQLEERMRTSLCSLCKKITLLEEAETS